MAPKQNKFYNQQKKFPIKYISINPKKIKTFFVQTKTKT